MYIGTRSEKNLFTYAIARTLTSNSLHQASAYIREIALLSTYHSRPSQRRDGSQRGRRGREPRASDAAIARITIFYLVPLPRAFLVYRFLVEGMTVVGFAVRGGSREGDGQAELAR